LKHLVDSFSIGNVLKEGVPVAIVGEPNVGKSTLLNALLNEDRAIVSNIPGTTRDVIEDELVIDGVRFRFIDTAGIREATDEIEQIGIQKTYEKIGEAKVVILMIDACALSKTASCHTKEHDEVLKAFETELNNIVEKHPDKNILIVVNKTDQIDRKDYLIDTEKYPLIEISAKQKTGLENLKKELTALADKGLLNQNEVIVSNARHYQALNEALQSILQVEEGLANKLSTDLLTIDIRAALHSLGEITGEITTDDVLDNIFRNFCIGK